MLLNILERKTIEHRLLEENQFLSKEKSQLSDVMNHINKMHHDLEQSVENDRRRLENHVQLLESQTCVSRLQSICL